MSTLTEKPAKKPTTRKEKTGLAQLGDVVKGTVLAIPKLRSLPNLNGLTTTVEEKMKLARQIEEDVTTAVKFLGDARCRLEACQDHLERKIVNSEVAQPMTEMREYLKGVLALEDLIYRSTAAMAYMKASFSQQFASEEEAIEMLTGLVNRGLLVHGSVSSAITVGYKHYDISREFGLDETDIADVKDVIAKFARVLKTLVRLQRQAEVKKALKNAEITLDQALDGANGTCLLDIPAEQYEKNGETLWRGGGQMLVRFTNEEVIPIQGIGSIEQNVKEMVETDVRLRCNTLLWDVPPGSGETAFEKVRTGVMRSMDLSSGEAKTYVSKMRILWYFVRRAVNAAKDKEATDKLKDEFRGRATISATEFFGLNGNGGQPCQGTALLEFEGSFIVKGGGTVQHLFLLAKNLEDDGEMVVEVAEVPEHLQKILGEFVGKKYSARDDFASCPEQLRRILRGIRGHADMAHATAE
ncbi:MAG: hypothetical protein NTY81_04055 [Candidatus Staskawiczbacteria bacterium]|nr:hypothetical protein [Candidatus Staskawiczbacteria bacterium]